MRVTVDKSSEQMCDSTDGNSQAHWLFAHSCYQLSYSAPFSLCMCAAAVFSDEITNEIPTKLQSASITDHPKSSELHNSPAFQVGF